MKYPLLLALSLPLGLLANPSGHDVRAGTAEIVHQGNLCQIKAGDRAIVHWEDFSNRPGELIHFIQPSKTSAVLNRVVGSNLSQILGDLKANGQIFLINPNGVIVGKDAKINCASFIASTFDVLDEDFLKGNDLKFKGDSVASIVNYGSIAAEDIDFYSRFFEHEGSIDAVQVARESGRVILVAEKGECKINGAICAPGGTVHLLGEKVLLNELTNINVSSSCQGGTVLVGGDYQGANPEIPNSELVYMAPGAAIRADALEEGDGGRVILWGNKQNLFYGSISAQGGLLGGDGGFVEISSPGNLGAEGAVCTLAPLGKAGMLLLDPTNIRIAAATTVGVVIGSPTTWLPAPPNPVDISAAAIAAFLAGGSVIIDTTTPPDGGVAGDITVNNSIVWSAATSLTLNASQDIFVNASVQHGTSAGGGVSLNAGRNIQINNPAATAAVAVGSQNAATLVTAVGDITLFGGNTAGETAQIGFLMPASPAIATAAGDITVNCNNLELRAGTNGRTGCLIGHGNISAATAAPFYQGSTIGANITVTTAGDITFFPPTPAVALPSLSPCQIGHGAITFSGSNANQDGDILVNCGGNLTMDSSASGGTIVATRIGHGFVNAQGAAFVPAPAAATIRGHIDVLAAGDIVMRSSDNLAGFSNVVQIGHGCNFNNSVVGSFLGNIRVCSGGDMTLVAGRGAPLRIGHFVTGTVGFPVVTANGSLDISVGGDLQMQTLQTTGGTAQSCLIGFTSAATAQTQPPLLNFAGTGPSILNLAVCGDANFFSAVPTAGTISARIGIGLASSDIAGSRTQVNIAINGNLNAANLTCPFSIASAVGDLNLAVGGNLTQTQSAASSFFSSGRGSPVQPAPLGAMRIYVGGDFLVEPAIAAAPIPAIGNVTVSPAANLAYSVDVRAGRDIVWPGNSPPAGGQFAGPLSLLGGHSFAAGELWSGTGTQLSSICGQPVTYAFSFNSACSTCAQLNTASQPIASTCGAFAISSNFNASAQLLTLNDLTIHSNCQNCAGVPISAVIGPNDVLHDFEIFNGSGFVDISSFFNIDLNQDINASDASSAAGDGYVSLSACNDLIINTPAGGPADITATGNITLIGDVDDSGTGNVNLQGGNVTSNGGNILIDAGFGGAGGTSSVNQTSGVVDSNNGSLTVQALFDISITDGPAVGSPNMQSDAGMITMVAGNNILLDGGTPTVTSVSGPIDMTAGNDIIILDAVTSGTGPITTLAGNDTYVTNTQVSTAGYIEMLTGVDMFLTSALISSSGSYVDLVVDNLFPTAPGIGPGSFNMDGSSSIIGVDYIRVYTALQGQNSIDPAATFNGATFAPGQLYVDSLMEMWCTYYPDGTLGFANSPVPFRIFYKDCLEQITVLANEVASQYLYMDLNFPFEYPDYLETYAIKYRLGFPSEIVSSYTLFDQENYFLRRRSYRLSTLKTYQPAKELPKL